MMTELTQSEIRAGELSLLFILRDCCEQYGLRFYLCGGTLLGSVRHQGFIPWDDDIDVFMPRPDYEKLQQLNRTRTLFQPYIRLLCFEDGTYDKPFMKLCNTRISVSTGFISETSAPWLWIDILPVDGLPEEKEAVREVYRRTMAVRRIMLAGLSRLGYGSNAFKKLIKPLIFRPYLRMVGVRRLSEKLADIAKENPYETSPNCGCVTWGLYGEGECMRKADFEVPAEVHFEGHTFPTFSCWDGYLRGLYGDYMQLPPVEKRVAHKMHAVWTEPEQTGAEP